MARTFSGSGQYLQYGAAVVSGSPFTVSLWFYTAGAIGTNIAMFSLSNTTSHYYSMYLGNTSNLVVFDVNESPTSQAAVSTAAATTNAWQHAAITLTPGAGFDTLAAFLNGGNKGTLGSTLVPTGLNRTDIGSLATAIPFNGLLAECALWGAVLTDAEIATLGVGVSPQLVRTGSLLSYWPLIGRYSPEPDLRGIAPMTVTGATVGDHPRIYYPSAAQVRHFASAAPSTFQAAWARNANSLIGLGGTA